MAYLINDDCIACGDCIQACPNGAVSEGRPKYRINPYWCTECVGFAEEPQCAAARPMQAIAAA
jgi:ferredoxin